MIKEKENNAKLSMVPLDVVPVIAIPTTSVATSTIPSTQSTKGANQLKKVVKNFSIQT